MNKSLEKKLQILVHRHEELGGLLSDADIISNQNRFRELSKEYSQLEPLVTTFNQHKTILERIASAQELLNDKEMRDLAQMELEELVPQQEEIEAELQTLLLPKDPNDERNVFLEIRAGTGGDEAAIFVGDLFNNARFEDTRKTERNMNTRGEFSGSQRSALLFNKKSLREYLQTGEMPITTGRVYLRDDFLRDYLEPTKKQ